MPVVIMGVSGAGKSVLGRSLAAALGWSFLEGDDLHPAANIAKMTAGLALDDDDRAPWLAAIAAAILRGDGRLVVSCSALKRSYRDRLRSASGRDPILVFLDAPRALLLQRLREREGHFMPPALLDSQLAILQPPQADEDALNLNAARPLVELTAIAAAFCRRRQAVS